MGVKQSGVQMSQFGAGLLLPSVALWWGWRGAALAAAVVAVAGLVMVRGAVPAVPPSPSRGTGHRLAALPAGVWWLTGYALASGAAIQATNVYLPLYAFERLEMRRAGGRSHRRRGRMGWAWWPVSPGDVRRTAYAIRTLCWPSWPPCPHSPSAASWWPTPWTRPRWWRLPRCSARAASPPTW
ncbi:hypothetical protein ACFQV4_23155 [Streptomyces thermocarboxydus]